MQNSVQHIKERTGLFRIAKNAKLTTPPQAGGKFNPEWRLIERKPFFPDYIPQTSSVGIEKDNKTNGDKLSSQQTRRFISTDIFSYCNVLLHFGKSIIGDTDTKPTSWSLFWTRIFPFFSFSLQDTPPRASIQRSCSSPPRLPRLLWQG